MSFVLEVYQDDEHIGTISVQDRRVHLWVGKQPYPFRTIEDACMALSAIGEVSRAQAAQTLQGGDAV